MVVEQRVIKERGAKGPTLKTVSTIMKMSNIINFVFIVFIIIVIHSSYHDGGVRGCPPEQLEQLRT